MPVEGLIFDYGGVLMDMRWDVARALEEAHGLRDLAIVETLYASDTWRQLEVGVGDRQAWLEEAHRSLEAIAGRGLPPLHARWREQQGLIQPNIELVRRLRSRYRVAVLSNADATLPQRLRTHGIHELFHDVVCSAQAGMAKPDPRIYALAARRLGVAPGSCVFIDDSERNVAAAREAGMQVVHFRIDRGHDLERMLADLGVRA